jgi:hypothetical protein
VGNFAAEVTQLDSPVINDDSISKYDFDEDYGVDGDEMRERGNGVSTADGRVGGATTGGTDPIDEASRAAEHLNLQGLLSTHESSYAATPMAELTSGSGEYTNRMDRKAGHFNKRSALVRVYDWSSSTSARDEDDTNVREKNVGDEDDGDGGDLEVSLDNNNDDSTVPLTVMIPQYNGGEGGDYENAVDGHNPENRADLTAAISDANNYNDKYMGVGVIEKDLKITKSELKEDVR